MLVTISHFDCRSVDSGPHSGEIPSHVAARTDDPPRGHCIAVSSLFVETRGFRSQPDGFKLCRT